METKIQKDGAYVFIVHGIVPEFMPQFAFRREKHFKTANKKILKCPYCGKPFETVDSTVKVNLYCHTSKTKLNCDSCIACRSCHNVVGIIYAA